MKLGYCFTDTELSTLLPQIMLKLWDLQIIKIGQNLRVNMEGFCKAGHIYILAI